MDSTNSTTNLIARAREMLAGITPGTWTYYSHEITRGVYFVATTEGDDIAKIQSREDARLFAVAPALVRDLCAAVEASEAEVARLRDALGDLVLHTNMRLVKDTRGWWQCPVCRKKLQNLTLLENGVGHAEDCAYALAYEMAKGIFNHDQTP